MKSWLLKTTASPTTPGSRQDIPRIATCMPLWYRWFAYFCTSRPAVARSSSSEVRFSFRCFAAPLIHSSRYCAFGHMGKPGIERLPSVSLFSRRKAFRVQAWPDGTNLWWSQSARSMTHMPGRIVTVWSPEMSSKGFSSRVPVPGPTLKTHIILCHLKMLSHFQQSVGDNCGGSSDGSTPASRTQAGVRVLDWKRRWSFM
mmetsp:Transcript_106072/g.300090  ORF Transcript_106072/g.300090 Transcript_106072/m.300090 type:complete len:200 (+) Transcript_106072:2723-3322(+)